MTRHGRFPSPESSPAAFFAGHPEALVVFDEIRAAIAELGATSMRVTKSQIAFRRRKGFAYVWRPAQYLRTGVPVVLSIALWRPVDSDRFKSVVNPSPGVWMHHIELRDPQDVDQPIREWLREAFDGAG
jgi:hypothetical protein